MLNTPGLFLDFSWVTGNRKELNNFLFADNSPTDRDFAVVSAMAIYRQLTQPLMQNSVVMKLVPVQPSRSLRR
ncbi:MAG TPA: hypothetical protein VF860_14045, partial [Candidatus Acidoferrales bacterium]